MSYSIHRYSPEELHSGTFSNPPCGQVILEKAIHLAENANKPIPDAIAQIRFDLMRAGASPRDIEIIFDILIEHKSPFCSKYSPDRFLGYGSYKEVFKAFGVNGQPGVIKFISSNNKTEEELLLYRQAANLNVQELFISSTYVPLYGYALPKLANLLLDPPITCLGYDMDYIDGIMFQPLAIPLTQYKPGKMVRLHRKFYRIPPHYKDALKMSDDTWLKDAVRVYGKPKVEKFITFAIDEGIGDLRPENLGYVNGRPVILDCLSQAKDSIR